MTRRMAVMLATAVTAFTLVITAGALWSAAALAGSHTPQALVARVQHSLSRDQEQGVDGTGVSKQMPATGTSTTAPTHETQETWVQSEGYD